MEPKIMPPKPQRLSKNHLFEQAAENLSGFRWKPAPFVVTEDIENEYFQYARDLGDRKFGRELCESEDVYEWSRWIRSQAMMANLDLFHQLIEFCSTFVNELAKIGKQSILATRAALAKAPIHQRPSRRIEFKAALPPEEPKLNLNQYETQVGGPHVFGARLLWWCAAAKSPKEFGYSAEFSREILTQPFWLFEMAEDRTRKLLGDQRPLNLLQEAVTYCVENLEGSETELPPEDGPGPAGTFSWKGKQIKLTTQQSNLMSSLWKRCGKPRDIQQVIEEAWVGKPNTTKNAVATCASRLNNYLNDESIPFTISVEDRFVTLRCNTEAEL